MSQDMATIVKTNGQSFDVPRQAIPEYRRIMGEQIATIRFNTGETAPSVVPETVEPPKAETVTVDESNDDESSDEGEPSMDWTKAELQAYCDANGIEYQNNDTKSMLMTFIGANK